MIRRRLLLTTGFAFCTSLTGCLGVGLSNESPDPPESCEPANPGLELPEEATLNKDNIGTYVKKVEEKRYLSQTSYPEYTTIHLSVQSVTPYDEGFVVDVVGEGSDSVPVYSATVSLRKTVPDNVTVESVDATQFSSLETLQEAIDTAQDRLTGQRCRGRGAADVSGSELEQLKTAFEQMEPDEDDFYYLQGDACYLSVKFDESLVTVALLEDVPGGESVESVEAERFDVKPLQDAIHDALARSEDNRNQASSDLSEAEYNQLRDAFEEMEPDEDDFYYLQHNEGYAAIKLQKGVMVGDFAPWVARYYVDDAQVRVTFDHIDNNEGLIESTLNEGVRDADLEDPTESQVIVC